jgi:hypothetical protein
MSTSPNALNGLPPFQGVTLDALPKSHVFTANLPPDPLIPSPQASKDAPNQRLRVSRPVKSALFTWVAPEKTENPQLLATSPAALRDLGLDAGEAQTEDFRNLVSGNRIYEDHYPWGMNVVGRVVTNWVQRRIMGDGSLVCGLRSWAMDGRSVCLKRPTRTPKRDMNSNSKEAGKPPTRDSRKKTPLSVPDSVLMRV